MPTPRAQAAPPGVRRAIALALVLLFPLASPGPAAAQDAPAPRAGAAAKPNAGPVGPGTAPLQNEPGDIWAEVHSWGRGRGEPAARRRTGDGAAGQADAAPTPAAKPKRTEPCAAEDAGCTRRGARPRANPG